MLVSIVLLVLLLIYNFQLFAKELTVKSDPNDNIYHFALVDEASDILKSVMQGEFSPFYIFDSFNKRWNEGFALSTYYSHLPQAIIAFFGLIPGISAYDMFNFIKYLMLALLPLTFFISGRVLGLNFLFSLFLAAFSRLIITDGLYGIDVSSFLWRGWGISAQLTALFFLPLALSYTYRYLTDRKYLGRSILFNICVFQAHSGVFYMLALMYPLILLTHFDSLKQIIRRFFVFGISLFIFLGYFLLPFFLQSQYRNFSYWDSLWKFNSFGLNEILVWMADGKIFDFGRPSVLTLLVMIGFFIGLIQGKRRIAWFSYAFVLYLFFLFGRYGPLGSLIDLIPGFSEFHLHRFVVMVQISGIYLAGWALYTIVEKTFIQVRKLDFIHSQFSVLIGSVLIVAGVMAFIWADKPVIDYIKYNDKLITEGNIKYSQDNPDYQKIITRLRSLPEGRVYSGRPGNWGRDFKVGETPLYMALSRDGFATIGFAPQSWSPNSEFDQFFDENNRSFYNLLNVRYLILPESVEPPDFAKKVAQAGKYRLFSVRTDGWFSHGTTSTSFSGKKTWFYNIIKLWIGSTLIGQNEYPTIAVNEDVSYKREYNIRLNSLVNYDILFADGSEEKNKNIWQDTPLYISPVSLEEVSIRERGEKVLPQGYRTVYELDKECKNCIVVLRQTYHPNWRVTINGEKVDAFPVFPYYIGILLNTPGKYTIEAVYKPGNLKVILIIVQILIIIALLMLYKGRGKVIKQIRDLVEQYRSKYQI